MPKTHKHLISVFHTGGSSMPLVCFEYESTDHESGVATLTQKALRKQEVLDSIKRGDEFTVVIGYLDISQPTMRLVHVKMSRQKLIAVPQNSAGFGEFEV